MVLRQAVCTYVMVVQLDVLVGLQTVGVAESLTLMLLGPFSPSIDMTSVSSLAVNCQAMSAGYPWQACSFQKGNKKRCRSERHGRMYNLRKNDGMGNYNWNAVHKKRISSSSSSSESPTASCSDCLEVQEMKAVIYLL